MFCRWCCFGLFLCFFRGAIWGTTLRGTTWGTTLRGTTGHQGGRLGDHPLLFRGTKGDHFPYSLYTPSLYGMYGGVLLFNLIIGRVTTLFIGGGVILFIGGGVILFIGGGGVLIIHDDGVLIGGGGVPLMPIN